MRKPVDGNFRFVYLETLKTEYEPLIGLLSERFGSGFIAEARGYRELTDLTQIRAYLQEPHTVVEIPLHTAARLMRTGGQAQFKVIASTYTFTEKKDKIVFFFTGEQPTRNIKRLVCASHESIATQIFRAYALTRQMKVELIDANVEATGGYDGVRERLRDAESEDTAFLISGVDEIEKVTREFPRVSKREQMYATLKERWQKQELASLGSGLPELPGTVLVARIDSTASAPAFLRPLLETISEWADDDKAFLERHAMGPPCIGTPISAIATVVYMELLAAEIGRASLENAPLLEYDDFLWAPAAENPKQVEELQESAKFLQLAADRLVQRRSEWMRGFTLRAYLGEDDGNSPAQRAREYEKRELRALANRLTELEAARKGDAAVLVRATESLFQALASAAKSFRSLVAATEPLRAQYVSFKLPMGEGGPSNIELTIEINERAYDKGDARQKRQHVLERGGTKLKEAAFRCAALIFRHRSVSNQKLDEVRREHEIRYDHEKFLDFLRKTFPVIVSRRDKAARSQALDGEKVRLFLSPESVSSLERWRALQPRDEP
jgi:hypothetical protein